MDKIKQFNDNIEQLLSEYENVGSLPLQQEIIKKIISITDDDATKLKLIEIIDLEFHKVAIIKTLKSDDNKIKLIDKLHEFDKTAILLTIKDDEKKIKTIDKLFYSENILAIFKSINSDDLKIKGLQNFDDIGIKINVLKSLKDDEKKYRTVLSDTNISEEYKANILTTLNDDNIKIKSLEKIEEINNRRNIIKAIKDEDLRIRQIDNETNPITKAMIIQTVADVEKKIKLLEKVKGKGIECDEMLIDIISDIPDENKRILALTNITDTFCKCQVVKTISSQEKIMKIAEQQHDEKQIAGILSFINNDEFKMHLIDEMKNDKYKTLSMLNLSNQNAKKYMHTELNGVLDLPSDMTVGIEIESEGPNGAFIRLNDNMLHDWDVKDDRSLDLFCGVEVSSSILHATQENTEDIYTVCEMLKRVEQKSNANCGGHIHIGADYLKSKDEYINLMSIWCNAEKEIYDISNAKGEVPRDGVTFYAAPISNEINKAIKKGVFNVKNEKDLDEFIDKVLGVQKSRLSGINFRNVNYGKNTIEFRLSNGTLDANTWIENINFFGGILKASKELAQIQKKETDLTDEEKKKIEEYNTIIKSDDSNQKAKSLINLVFNDEKKRDIYNKRYMVNHGIIEKFPEYQNRINVGISKEKIDFKKNIKNASMNIRQGEIDEQMTDIVNEINKSKMLIDEKERE